MLGTDRLLVDLERALEKRASFVVTSLPFEKCGQVVKAVGYVDVLEAENLLPDGERLLVQLKGLIGMALRLEQMCQVVHALRGPRIL